jgi:hypothetical protein
MKKTGILSIASMTLLAVCTLPMVGCSDIVAPEDAMQVESQDVEGTPVIVEADFISNPTRGIYYKAGLYNTFSVIGVQGTSVKWNNVLQTKDASGNWVAETSMFWPTSGSMNCYGILPSGKLPGISNIVMGGIKQGKKTVAPPYRQFDYEVPDSNKHQVDLMIANTMNVTQFTNNGKVSYTFRHCLCFMNFRIADKMKDLDITVGSISFHNVRTSGTFQFDNSILLKSTGTWVASDSKWGKITFECPSPVHLVYKKTKNTYAYTDCSGDSLLMMMPNQTTTVWAKRGELDANGLQHYESLADADANHNSYFEIKCQLKKTIDNVDYWLVRTVDTTNPANSKWEWKTEPTWTHVYLPGKAQTWNQGSTNKVSIDFPIFYDENGDPIAEYPDVVLDTNVDFDSLITVEEEWSEDADNSQTINFSTL